MTACVNRPLRRLRNLESIAFQQKLSISLIQKQQRSTAANHQEILDSLVLEIRKQRQAVPFSTPQGVSDAWKSHLRHSIQPISKPGSCKCTSHPVRHCQNLLPPSRCSRRRLFRMPDREPCASNRRREATVFIRFRLAARLSKYVDEIGARALLSVSSAASHCRTRHPSTSPRVHWSARSDGVVRVPVPSTRERSHIESRFAEPAIIPRFPRSR